MRVITGSARGHKLISPEGTATRPTSETVKEAVFSILGYRTENARVLDLFAGTGQMGIEALSRGAARCTFADSARQAVKIIEQNLEHTKLADRARVVNSDAGRVLEGAREKFDIILLDPPYSEGLMGKMLELSVRVADPNGIIVCETSKTEQLPERVGEFIKFREYGYGKKKITTYVGEHADD